MTKRRYCWQCGDDITELNFRTRYCATCRPTHMTASYGKKPIFCRSCHKPLLEPHRFTCDACQTKTARLDRLYKGWYNKTHPGKMREIQHRYDAKKKSIHKCPECQTPMKWLEEVSTREGMYQEWRCQRCGQNYYNFGTR